MLLNQRLSSLIFKTNGYASLKVNFLVFQFAEGMASMFGVLFIFSLGEGLMRGLLFILLYFGLQRLVVFFSLFVTAQFVARLGYRKTILIALIFFVSRLLLLIQTDNSSLWPLVLGAIIGGFGISAYYLSFHSLFLEDNDNKRIGEQIALLEIAARVAGMVAPFAAGLIIDSFGFDAMFATSLVLILFSAIPLRKMQVHKRHSHGFEVAKVRQFIAVNKRVFKSMYYWSLTDGIQVFFWSIYMFLIVKSYTNFGFITAFVVALNGLAMYVAGKIFDTKAHKGTFIVASLLVCFTWIARFLSKNTVQVVVSDATNRFASPFWWMKIRRQELLAGEKFDSLLFGIAHEVVWTFGYLSALLLGFILLAISAGRFEVLIPVVVMATLVSVVMSKDL